jgi:uncharacterized membrane protein YqaE (UPF0057 family)
MSTHQTKRLSAIESMTNVVLGFVLAMLAWIPLAYAMDIPYSFNSSIIINITFTVISFVRGYLVRRAFVRFGGKQ